MITQESKYRKQQVLDGPLLTFDIPALTERLKKEYPWEHTDHNAITLFKNHSLCVVLIALHAEGVLHDHQIDAAISLHVLEGRIKFVAGSKSVLQSAGHLLTLHPGIKHAVHAVEESVLLLTLARHSPE